MSLSDRIAVMNAGKIEQIGPPTEIYEAPRSSFVAAFIGDTNFFEGRVRQIIDSEHCQLSIDGFPDLICFNDKGIGEGNWVNLSIRPEKFSISHDEPPPDPSYNVAAGVVEDVIYLGASSRFWVSIGDYRVSVFQQQRRFALDERPIRWRDKVWIRWHSDDGFMLERYREADEDLINLPPEEVGETTNGHDHCEP
jgi:spermidine/putrescine transport system ATP-binding protein